jgi:hypothetical protein
VLRRSNGIECAVSDSVAELEEPRLIDFGCFLGCFRFPPEFHPNMHRLRWPVFFRNLMAIAFLPTVFQRVAENGNYSSIHLPA